MGCSHSPTRDHPKWQEKSKTGRAHDRAKVAGDQDHEVRYEASKTGVSKGEVKTAVKTAGNSRKNVEAELGRKS